MNLQSGEASGGEAGGRDHEAGEGAATDLLLWQGGHTVGRGRLRGDRRQETGDTQSQ